MVTVVVKKKADKLGRMRESLMKINGQKTSIGYFANQGMHVGRDGVADYSYTALAQALEIGFFPAQGITRTPMPFMHHIGQRTIMGITRSTKVRRAFRAWGRKLDKRGNPLVLLNAVGEYAKMQAATVFNNPLYFPQAPKNNTPLVETGELFSKFTYRTSFDNRVRRT